VYYNYNFSQTEPEFSSGIAKSSGVVSPVAIEIHTAVLTSLKHLKYTKYTCNDKVLITCEL